MTTPNEAIEAAAKVAEARLSRLPNYNRAAVESVVAAIRALATDLGRNRHPATEIADLLSALGDQADIEANNSGMPDTITFLRWAKTVIEQLLAASPAIATDLPAGEGCLISRDEAVKVAEEWLIHFGDRQPPQHVSAQQWAGDAVRDIADALRSVPPPLAAPLPQPPLSRLTGRTGK